MKKKQQMLSNHIITLVIIFINYVKHVILNMTDTFDDSIKKMKNTEQDARAKAETMEDHAEGKPSSETLNKAKEKIKDALT